MKIKDLIKKLNKLDPDSEIILSSDSEGNSFNYLNNIESNLFVYQVQGQVELCDKDELRDIDECFEPQKCVVLFP